MLLRIAFRQCNECITSTLRNCKPMNLSRWSSSLLLREIMASDCNRIVELQSFFLSQEDILACAVVSQINGSSRQDSHTAQKFFPCSINCWTWRSNILWLRRIMFTVIQFWSFVVSESALECYFWKLDCWFRWRYLDISQEEGWEEDFLPHSVEYPISETIVLFSTHKLWGKIDK